MFPKNLLIFLFVAIMATSIAEAQYPIGIININMTLYCTPNGLPGVNGLATPIFPNAALQVVCTEDVATIPWNVTAIPNGVYLVVMIPRPNATVNAITSNCRLYVQTPLSNCNVTLPPVGLVSNLEFVRTAVMGIGRSITYMIPSGFMLQS